MSLVVVKEYQPTADDLRLEATLTALAQRIHLMNNDALKSAAWREYAKLHATRSPEYVTWLEKQQGIYR